MKIGIDNGGNWTAEYYEATVVSANDYYPFGSAMAGRKFSSGAYRYGFNGMEKDDEVKGEGNSYDFGARIFDSRVGRWLAVDPLANKHSGWSPYNGLNNSPLVIVDPDGKSGEPVIEDGKIVVYMNYYFYGNSNYIDDYQSVINAANYLETELNKNPSKEKWIDGKEYEVVFKISAEIVCEDDAIQMAKGNTGNNYDPRMNFVRVEEGVQPQNSSANSLVSTMESKGKMTANSRSNNKNIPSNSILIKPEDLVTTTWIHEAVAHGLFGRNFMSHLSNSWSNNTDPTKVSIRATIVTTGVPEEFGTFNTEAGRIVLDKDKREVLPEDKPLRMTKVTYDNGTTKMRVGGTDNTIFTSNGNKIIYNDKGEEIKK